MLRAHCAEVGRDPAAIERTVGCKITIRATEAEAERRALALPRAQPDAARTRRGRRSFWTGTPEQIAETMVGYRRIGFHTFIVELPAPYDDETIETLMTMVEADGRGGDRQLIDFEREVDAHPERLAGRQQVQPARLIREQATDGLRGMGLGFDRDGVRSGSGSPRRYSGTVGPAPHGHA